MHHHPCLCRLLDNLASFGFGDHPLADHHGRQTTATGDLPPNFSTPKHTASPDSSSCLQEGCQPQRCVLHEICIGCASLPPPSSFLLHVPFVSLASSGIVFPPPAAVALRSWHNTPPPHHHPWGRELPLLRAGNLSGYTPGQKCAIWNLSARKFLRAPGLCFISGWV